MQISIVERKRGVSSWIKLGPASLGPLVEGLVFCTKDTRTGHWDKLWQENGRTFSLVEEQKGVGLFCWRRYERWMLLPKGNRQQGLKPKLEEASPLSCWLLGPQARKGDDLRSWGTQMAKLWGLKGNLGLAKLESGKVLLEFEVMAEAKKALKAREVSVGGFFMRLEKWSQMTGCLMEGERERERERPRPTLRSLPTEEKGKPFEAVGEVEGESADGTPGADKRVGVPLGLFSGACWVAFWAPGSYPSPSRKAEFSLGPKEVENPRRAKAWKTIVGFGLASSDDGQSPPQFVESRDHFDGQCRLCEAELLSKERSKTDLALFEEALRYESDSFQFGCLVSGPYSSPSSFSGQTPLGEYCVLSGDGKGAR
ncbi:hypothetical protein CK203_079677 [Vitis vinifera]|uniref:DUF4283 domain-containing protein n=1 Tax=Vitis vinifera TaxID=29760 RepID=A0A438DKX3_VITVI|nr:hypothetical protein CK203_079677 [Vitis vinifera]